MTKPKTTPIKDTQGAKDNRQAVANFDQLGLADDELIAQLEKRGYWGYLFWDNPDGSERKIEVKRD